MNKRRLTDKQLRRINQNQSQRLDVSDSSEGIVVKHYGKEVIVEDEGRHKHICKLRQNLGEIACGDRVAFHPQCNTEHGVVVAIQDRNNLLEKTGFGGKPKPVASNIDNVINVCAIKPPPNRYLIDRYIVATENLPACPILVINKIDLEADDKAAITRELHDTYDSIGIPVIETSAKQGQGIDHLLSTLNDHTSILVGLSGVGKSSLVNCIIPEVNARVGDVSAASQEGTHTTTVSSLYHIPTGGQLIDSPGVRDFTPVITSREQVLRGFTELGRHVGECKFNDCAHDTEPGCAIRKAIEFHEISALRLQSYQHMLEDLDKS